MMREHEGFGEDGGNYLPITLLDHECLQGGLIHICLHERRHATDYQRYIQVELCATFSYSRKRLPIRGKTRFPRTEWAECRYPACFFGASTGPAHLTDGRACRVLLEPGGRRCSALSEAERQGLVRKQLFLFLPVLSGTRSRNAAWRCGIKRIPAVGLFKGRPLPSPQQRDAHPPSFGGGRLVGFTTWKLVAKKGLSQ